MTHMDMKRPDWEGRTVVCIGGGPSLSDAQLSIIGVAHQHSGCRVIGVNDAYRRAPWIDAVYAGDCLWWNVHHGAIKQAGIPAELWTCDNVAAKRYGINRVRGANREGLGLWQVHTGGNSGYQAINLAFLWGAKRIVLVGYDMQPTGGRKHWFGDHPAPLVQSQSFGEWLHRFDKMARDLEARGVEVINCTEETALRCFPLAPIGPTLGVDQWKS